MDSAVILLLLCLALLVAGLAALTFWIWLQTRAGMNDLAQRIEASEQARAQTFEAFGQIQKTLGELQETGRQMQALGKEISSLGDLLKAPSLRGPLGESLLADLLAQILPREHYELQYTFKDGVRVDAVVRLRDGLVPVDAKFPLESFERLIQAEEEKERARRRKDFVRAVKGHMDAIAEKYIRPEEGTFEFALMYIPAENVYYETIIKDEQAGEDTGILAHAMKRRVIPVSPNSFYAYLQVIVLGLKGMQIEQQARQILDYLGTLQGDVDRLSHEMGVLGTHLQRASSKYDEVSSGLFRLRERLEDVRRPSLTAQGQTPARLEGGSTTSPSTISTHEGQEEA